MFFLIRVAFWLSIVILLLPTPKGSESSAGPATADALAAAGAAVSDMKQFCTRQPSACEVGSQAASAFGQKAQSSAKMLFDLFADPKPGDEQPADAAKQAPATTSSIPPRTTSQDTLTATDRTPAFRGPRAKQADRQGGRAS